MSLISNLQLPDRVQRELIRGEHARGVFAIRAQHALKETLDASGPSRHINGLGRRRAVIHPELAARLRVKYWGDVGHDPLTDPDFLRSLLKDNPFLRVQTAPEKLSLRVDGFRDESGKQENRKGTLVQTAGATARHAAPGEPARPKLPPGGGRVSPVADRTSRDENTCSGHETASGRSGRLGHLSGTQESRNDRSAEPQSVSCFPAFLRDPSGEAAQ